MKKILFLITLLLLLVSCSSKEEPLQANLLVNVTYDNIPVSPSIVKIYEAQEFDTSLISEFADTGNIYSKEGNKINPLFTSDNLVGVNTFENVPHGNYLIIAFYKPEGFTFANFFYYGYKYITLNKQELINFDFKLAQRGEFVEF